MTVEGNWNVELKGGVWEEANRKAALRVWKKGRGYRVDGMTAKKASPEIYDHQYALQSSVAAAVNDDVMDIGHPEQFLDLSFRPLKCKLTFKFQNPMEGLGAEDELGLVLLNQLGRKFGIELFQKIN